MAQRVKDRSEIILNGEGNRYRLSGDGRVRQTLQSQYPQKRVDGDFDSDSNPRTSIVTWDDWTGGIGAYSTDGRENLNRSSFSKANGRYKNHLTLPPLYTVGADGGQAGITTGINELGTKLYVALANGREIWDYTPSATDGAWGSNRKTLSTSAYQSISFTLAGTDYVAFAEGDGTGYTYSSNGTSFSDETAGTVAPVFSFAFWDNRLWGLALNGQLWFSTTIGVSVNDAKLPLPTGYATRLFVGPDAAGEDILYAASEVGLWAHDAANARFVKTKVVFPRQHEEDANSITAQGAATWNGEIYISAGGMTVYRYNPVAGTVQDVGLNRDAGMPVGTTRGIIVSLVPTHTGLLAIMDGYSASDGTVWEYNGIGWHYYGQIDGSGATHHVSDVGRYYRFYHARVAADDIGYMELQTGLVNPEIDALKYDGDNNVGIHVTPWFNAGQNEIDKTAIRTRIDCSGMTSTETVKVEYALDYSANYNGSFFTVGSGGDQVTVNTFPTLANNAAEAGTVFRSIRFRLTLNRGSTATLSPNVKSLSLEWRRKLKARYGFTFDIDRTARYAGRSPKQQKAALVTAFEQATMAELTYVDDDGDTQNYYVDITSMEDVQETGHGEAGVTRITAVES